MKASLLIIALQKAIDEHGDLEVIKDTCLSYDDMTNEPVEFVDYISGPLRFNRDWENEAFVLNCPEEHEYEIRTQV